MLDVLCEWCRGCGRSVHTGCDPADHLDWEAFPEEDKPGLCWQCLGRGWTVATAWSRGLPPTMVMLSLRLPCGGCSESQLVPAP